MISSTVSSLKGSQHAKSTSKHPVTPSIVEDLKLLKGRKYQKFVIELGQSKDPVIQQLRQLIKNEEVRIPLMLAFKNQLCLLSELARYATNEVKERDIQLLNGPDLPTETVFRSIIYLAHSNDTMHKIRESGDRITIRVVIELLHRLGSLIFHPEGKDQEIRRSACALVDVVLINMANPQLYPGHVYLFTRAIRALIHHRKLPAPSFVRMQQIEYLLNPLSHRAYFRWYTVKSKQPQEKFHDSLSSKLGRKNKTTKEESWGVCLTVSCDLARNRLF